jgi:hypothetical protein
MVGQSVLFPRTTGQFRIRTCPMSAGMHMSDGIMGSVEPTVTRKRLTYRSVTRRKRDPGGRWCINRSAKLDSHRIDCQAWGMKKAKAP